MREKEHSGRSDAPAVPRRSSLLRQLITAFGLGQLSRLGHLLLSIVLAVPVPMPVALAISDAVIGPFVSTSSTLALF